MNHPPIEEVLARGDSAAALLASPAFIDVMNDLSNFHLSAMASCKPGEADSEARDYHHQMIHALQEIVGELNTRVSASEEAREHFGVDEEA